MSSEDVHALLAAVADDPDDDAPRVALADWLEKHGDADRAELIRVQCERARLRAYDHEEERRLWLRQEELLRRNGDAWKGAPPAGLSVWFERGLLCVQVEVRGLTDSAGSAWWDRHAAWVESVSLSNDCDDGGLSEIASRLQGRPRLYLWSKSVTDAGLAPLVGLTRLRTLSLVRPITDRALATVAGMRQLRDLRLSSEREGRRCPGPTEAGIRELCALTDLRRLVLIKTWGSDANWPDLARFGSLRELVMASRHRQQTLAGPEPRPASC